MKEQHRWFRIRTVRLGTLVLLVVAFVLGLAAWGRWAGVVHGQSQGCAVYPIALHEDILAGAQVGDIFLDIGNGVGAGEFGWLAWNDNPGSQTASALADRIAYPGNSTDPTDGYTNPLDPSDHEIQIGDLIWGHTGTVNAASVRDALDDHIATGRYLRVVVWDSANCDGTGSECEGDAPGGGASVTYQVSSFALVKLLSYDLAAKTIMLEFVRRDDFCGQGGGAGACDPYLDLYTSQTGGYGLEQVSNLSIYGPNVCTSYGDPYTPLTYNNIGTPNPWYGELDGVYRFRLYIPGDYESRALSLTGTWNGGADTNDILRVEIWDPDCYNDPFLGNQFVITNTFTGITMTISNACDPNDRREACVPVLRAQDPQNPFGFVRIDENRGVGTPPGNGQCGQPASYNADYNTVTEYTLYYYRRRGDGSLERRDLARYTKGGADGDSDTDMLWVCPGGSLPDDPPADAGFADVGDGSFAIDLSTEVPDIYADPVDGHRSLFLDVRGLVGASENGFDLWAGPRYQTVPSEVNARNVDIILQAGAYHFSAGATFFGIGHLPVNSNATEMVTHTLTYIPPEWAGRTLYVSTFDNDCGACGVTFLFDTMPYSDWHYDGLFSEDNVWYTNVFTIPSTEQGYTFYGGALQAVYQANAYDNFGWKVSRFPYDLSKSTKEASEPTVYPGDVLTYTIVLNNVRMADVPAVSLNDPIPDHTTYVTGSAQVDPPGSGVLTDTASAIEWSGSVTASESITLTFQVTVDPDVVEGTEIINIVAIDDGTCEFYKEATVLVEAIPTPMLEVAKQASPDPVQVGGQLTYTLWVTNTGGVDLHATVTDTLPARVTPGGVLTWAPTITAPGGVWTEQFTVTVDMGCAGLLTNVVQVSTGEGVTGVYTETSETQLRAVLAGTKQADPDPVQTGAQLTYTIVVSNTGPEDAPVASLNDPIPDHTTYVTGSAQVDPPGSGVLTDTASAIEWSGPVTASEAITLTFQVTVDPDVVEGTEITNTVAISDGACGFYRETTVLVGTQVQSPPKVYLPLILKVWP